MKKGPKCEVCGKTIQLLSYDAAYLKIVRAGQSKAKFVCWKCAEKLLGEKLSEISGTQASEDANA
jgi:hypothetical protein